MYSKHHIVLSGVIAAVMVLATFASVVSVAPANAQTTDVIVGTWKNSVYTDVYTIYPMPAGATVGAAKDVHSYLGNPQYVSTGTWVKESGLDPYYGAYPYEYIWYWDFGPEQGGKTFTDYIHVVDNDHLTYVNNYGNMGSNTRISTNQPPTAVIMIESTPFYSVISTSPVHIVGYNSYDPEDTGGVIPSTALQYEWGITGPTTGMPWYATVPNGKPWELQVKFEAAGDYVVTLTVTDSGGLTDTTTKTITITDPSDSIKTLQSSISGFDQDDFKDKNAQRTLIRGLDSVTQQVSGGKYANAIAKLQSAILPKVDGCTNANAPDKDDLIVRCPAQTMVYSDVSDIIQELRTLQGS